MDPWALCLLDCLCGRRPSPKDWTTMKKERRVKEKKIVGE